jgi:ribonuclease Y
VVNFSKMLENLIELGGIGILLFLAVALCCAVAGYFLHRFVAERRTRGAAKKAETIIADAQKRAQEITREATVQIKNELYEMRRDFENQTRDRKKELSALERRLIQKEENLEKKVDLLGKKEEDTGKRERDVASREKAVRKKDEQLDQVLNDQRKKLQELSGLTVADAKKMLFAQLEGEVKRESALQFKRLEDELREEADKKARRILSDAIQRCAVDHVVESTVSVVHLPNDEMKGRIIGREGRNIRALENATGIDVIIDDTPEAVILSGYDPIRREIARISLERLVSDGRIHPARIEEVVRKVEEEMAVSIREAGEQATLEVGVHGLHQEEIRLLGRLKYRTSFGQNQLQHSKEVAFLAGIMAAELGVNADQAKRAALLHDIGKGVDHEMEGAHAKIGADLAKKYGESPIIVNAIAAHHGEAEQSSVTAVLTQSADAVSAARPGARRETLETYIKRLEKLEHIADSFAGVEKAYAIQAGREIRIMVEPDKVTDAEAYQLARDITKKVESELEYPGQVKVTVIRETRAVEYAK